MSYKNPAAAVGSCRRKGKRSPEAIFVCAVNQKPRAAGVSWTHEAKRLSGLAGTKRKRRRRR